MNIEPNNEERSISRSTAVEILTENVLATTKRFRNKLDENAQYLNRSYAKIFSIFLLSGAGRKETNKVLEENQTFKDLALATVNKANACNFITAEKRKELTKLIKSMENKVLLRWYPADKSKLTDQDYMDRALFAKAELELHEGISDYIMNKCDEIDNEILFWFNFE